MISGAPLSATPLAGGFLVSATVTLAVANSASASASSSPTITQHNLLDPDDSDSEVTSTSPTLSSSLVDLSPDDSLSESASSSSLVTPTFVVAPDDSASTSALSSPIIIARYTITPDDSSQESFSTSPHLTFQSVILDLYPVFSIRPNWAQPIVERLEWLTDVLGSDNGTEQRRGLRLTPRRTFELTFNPQRNERSFLDRWLHNLATDLCYFPLWHDKSKLLQAAPAGDVDLLIDNTYREFETGGLAFITDGTAFNYELVEIAYQDSENLFIVGTLQKSWKKGATVYPVRLCRLQHDAALGHPSTRVGAATLAFTVEGPNYYGSEDFEDHYLDRPVLSVEPNRIENINLDFTRMADTFDSQTGRVFVNDDADRAFTSLQYTWLLHGREEHHKFRQMLYHVRGRLHSLWLPTFAEDLFLNAPAEIGNDSLSVEFAGLAYTGVPAPGREHIWVKGQGGAKITGVAVTEGGEELGLDELLEADIAVGAQISFMDVARFNQDGFEITHHTDSEGTSEARAVLTTFNPDRDGTGDNEFRIPEAEMTDDPCGSPEGVATCAFHFQSYVENWSDIYTPEGDIAGTNLFDGYDIEVQYHEEGSTTPLNFYATSWHAYVDEETGTWDKELGDPTKGYARMNYATGVLDVYLIGKIGNEQYLSSGYNLYFSEDPSPTDVVWKARWRQITLSNYEDPDTITVETSGAWNDLDTFEGSATNLRAQLPVDMSDNVGACGSVWEPDLPLSITFAWPSDTTLPETGQEAFASANLYARARGGSTLHFGGLGQNWFANTGFLEANPFTESDGGVTVSMNLSYVPGAYATMALSSSVPLKVEGSAPERRMYITVAAGSGLSGYSVGSVLNDHGDEVTFSQSGGAVGGGRWAWGIEVLLAQFRGDAP